MISISEFLVNNRVNNTSEKVELTIKDIQQLLYARSNNTYDKVYLKIYDMKLTRHKATILLNTGERRDINAISLRMRVGDDDYLLVPWDGAHIKLVDELYNILYTWETVNGFEHEYVHKDVVYKPRLVDKNNIQCIINGESVTYMFFKPDELVIHAAEKI